MHSTNFFMMLYYGYVSLELCRNTLSEVIACYVRNCLTSWTRAGWFAPRDSSKSIGTEFALARLIRALNDCTVRLYCCFRGAVI